MSSIANTITTGQFAQGLKDLANGVESNDAGDAANALSQILAGIYTAAQPLGDFTGIVNLTAAAITALKIARDANDPNKRVDPLDLLALAGNLAAVTISLGKNHPLLRAANFALGLGQVILGSVFSGDARGEVNPDVNRDFNRGTAWTRPRDPLILDLDGDGIELTSSTAAVLFDHNADGIKTGTQWVKASDALLVRDLDGNGVIDSGRELFGDQTRIEVTRSTFDPNLVNANGTIGGMVTYTSTQTAANGFEALRPLDKDGSGASDGQIDASDVAYASLQVWQDLNQDGISQANEMRTLAQAGISAIALSSQTTVQTANGQTQQITQSAETTGISSFTQTTTTGSTDAQGNPVSTSTSTTNAIHNINLGSNAFYREFLNNPAVTATAQALPQMQGAGLVRNMREAMSLGTASASALEQQVAAFKAAATAQERQTLVHSLIGAWGATSGLAEATVRNPVSSYPNWSHDTPSNAIHRYAQSHTQQYAQMTALERFNGQAVIEQLVQSRSTTSYNRQTNRYYSYTTYFIAIVELTLFHGHLILKQEGVRNAKNTQSQAAVSGAISPANDRLGSHWAQTQRARTRVRLPRNQHIELDTSLQRS